MVIITKVLLSLFLLFPYSFGAVWILTINEPGRAENLQGVSGLFFFSAAFTSLLSLWGYLWVLKYRRQSIFMLGVALFCTVIFLILGYPKSLGLVATTAVCLISCTWYNWHPNKYSTYKLDNNKCPKPTRWI